MSGLITPSTPEEEALYIQALKPSYRADYLAEEKRLGSKPNLEIDLLSERGGAILARNASDGTWRYIVPRTAVAWTEELYKTQLYTDEELAQEERTTPATQRQVDAVAKSLGAGKVLAIRARGDRTMVSQTVEGTTYIAFAQKHLMSDHFLGILAHELGHIVARDHTPENMVRTLNLPAEYLKNRRQEEDKADLFAVRKCFGPEIVGALAQRHADEEAAAHQQGESVDARYAQDIHTHGLERLTNAKEAARKAVEQGVCKAPETPHSEQAPAVPDVRVVVGKDLPR